MIAYENSTGLYDLDPWNFILNTFQITSDRGRKDLYFSTEVPIHDPSNQKPIKLRDLFQGVPFDDL